MTYIIVDNLRHADLCRMDTVADTPAEAQKFAADMAKRYGCTVHVLAIVGTVECPAKEPNWTKPMEASGWPTVY